MNLTASYALLGRVLEDRQRDPLAWWRFAVPRVTEALVKLTGPGAADEAHLRAANKTGKTELLAAYMLACLQKRPSLAGVPLPRWSGSVHGAQLVLDYKQQLLSVQPAYLRLLGTWPHHPHYQGEILTGLDVQPVGGSSDRSKWSKLHFLSQENRRSGLGVRADVIGFDEPPLIEILRELRKAGHAGRRSVILIGDTPTLRRQWAPLRLDYGDTPRSTTRRVDRERIECRWSLSEVAHWLLPEAEKDKLRRRYASDPLRDAREHGDYVDASGSCPFNLKGLQRLLDQCREPERIEWKTSRETDSETGRSRVLETVEVETWHTAKPGARYYIPVDPSSGTEDPERQHDPGALHVREMGSGDLVARYCGYLGSYGLGVLAAGLARQYNDALVEPETTGGWGEGVLRGLAEMGYGNVGHERVELDPGRWRNELGFRTTVQSRPGMIAAVQEWAERAAAGLHYAACPSRAVIECLMDTILDANGKAVGGPGVHDEDLILFGQGLRKCLRRSSSVSVPGAPVRTVEDQLAARIMGQVSGTATMRPQPSRPRAPAVP